MGRNSREEAASFLADKLEYGKYSSHSNNDEASSSVLHPDNGHHGFSPLDEESAYTPASPAYPSFKSPSGLRRWLFSIGGPARRRLVPVAIGVIFLLLMFRGSGTHKALLEENKENFLGGVDSGSIGVNTAVGSVADGVAVEVPTTAKQHVNEAAFSRPPTATPTEGPWDEEEEKLLHATGTLDMKASPTLSSTGNDNSHSHDAADSHFGHLGAASGKPKFDEYGHNEPRTNVSDYCTTWPVDSSGKYTPKTIPNDQRSVPTSYGPKGGWKKPSGFSIIGLVFYGRKRNVDILDCYLQQNLVRNGGYLDEVRFMVKTTNEDDIEWLEEFVKGTPEYVYQDLGNCTTEHGYGCIWEFAMEDDTMYIKIDDDVLYVHPDAVPQIVHTRLAVPEAFAVSAQIVNSPVMALEQWHYDAIHPFIPDPNSHPTRPATEEWRPSMSGVIPKTSEAYSKGATMDVNTPYNGHPWLLLSDSRSNTFPRMRTPMGDWQSHLADDPAFGPGWTKWGIAAQQEYSLLYNIELNEIHRYHHGRPLRYTSNTSNSAAEDLFPAELAALRPSLPPPTPNLGGEQLFDTQYQRSNLNFVAIWGHDIRLALPIGDDEDDFTKNIPRKLGRPFLIDTKAVVAHYSFFTQHNGIRTTDLMDRWRALANEVVCPTVGKGRGKTPWDTRCEGF